MSTSGESARGAPCPCTGSDAATSSAAVAGLVQVRRTAVLSDGQRTDTASATDPQDRRAHRVPWRSHSLPTSSWSARPVWSVMVSHRPPGHGGRTGTAACAAGYAGYAVRVMCRIGGPVYAVDAAPHSVVRSLPHAHTPARPQCRSAAVPQCSCARPSETPPFASAPAPCPVRAPHHNGALHTALALPLYPVARCCWLLGCRPLAGEPSVAW